MAYESGLCPGPRICHTTCCTWRVAAPPQEARRRAPRGSLPSLPATALNQRLAHDPVHGDRRAAARDAADPHLRPCTGAKRSPGLDHAPDSPATAGRAGPNFVARETTYVLTAPRS